MIGIIDCGSSKTKDISRILDEFHVSNKLVKLCDVVKQDFRLYSGIIISGSPILLTKGAYKYIKKFSFIPSINIPVLGICFGHQIIGLLYGSRIFMGEEVRYEQCIEIVNGGTLFQNLNRPFTFLEDHCEHINLPENFNLLARSNTCKNEAMKHESKYIYGVQFHPEASGENGKMVLKNFADFCSKA